MNTHLLTWLSVDKIGHSQPFSALVEFEAKKYLLIEPYVRERLKRLD